MAENVQIPNEDMLVPGDVVRFDFEIVQANQAQIELAIHEIKKAVATDERFDYQGSEIKTMGSLELQRDIELLSVYAKVRKTRRETREPIEYATLTGFDATVKASVIVFGDMLRHLKTTVIKAAAAVAETASEAGNVVLNSLRSGSKSLPALSWGLLLIAAVVAHRYFFGSRQRTD